VLLQDQKPMQYFNSWGGFFWSSPPIVLIFGLVLSQMQKSCNVIFKKLHSFVIHSQNNARFLDFALSQIQKPCNIKKIGLHYFGFHPQRMFNFWICIVARPKIVKYYNLWATFLWLAPPKNA
jgi:hypothetical protein